MPIGGHFRSDLTLTNHLAWASTRPGPKCRTPMQLRNGIGGKPWPCSPPRTQHLRTPPRSVGFGR